jgi:hypothetical protein
LSYRRTKFCAVAFPRRAGDANDANEVFDGIWQSSKRCFQTPSWTMVLSGEPESAWAESAGGAQALFLHGEIYESHDHPATALLNRFQMGGADAVAHTHGMFVAIILDKQRDQILFINDRVGARPVYMRQFGAATLFATRLTALPRADLPIDAGMVSCYLANGNSVARHTPYAGLTTMDPASVYCLCAQGIDSKAHWIPMPPPEKQTAPDRVLEGEYAELVERSVRRRLFDAPDVLLALSGGWDSSAVLGALRYGAGAQKVDCFSYCLDTPLPGSDESVAERQAKKASCVHRNYLSYNGDFAANLRYSAHFGEGIAPPLDEADALVPVEAWVTAHQRPALFAGEIYPSQADIAVRDREGAMAAVWIRTLSSIAWLMPFLPARSSQEMQEGYQALRANVMTRVPETYGPRACQDFILTDQRFPHVFMPWREYYWRHLPVREPFIDNELLDFFGRVPTRLRRAKLLHRQACLRRYPDLFTIPRALRANYALDEAQQQRNHEGTVREMIGVPSRLDVLIPAETLIRLLELVVGNVHPNFQAQAATWIRRYVPMAWRLRATHLVDLSHSGMIGVSPAAVLRRLLVLRLALADQRVQFGCGDELKPA